jgi:transmembrane sensor
LSCFCVPYNIYSASNMNIKAFNILVDKVNNNSATDEELAQYNACLNKLTLGTTDWADLGLGQPEIIKKKLWARIQGARTKSKVRTLWPRIAAVASIVLAMSFGGYFLVHKQQGVSYFKNDIPPGHNQATLTLSNGQKIILTKGLSGNLAQQGNTVIGVNNQNVIAYTAGGANAGAPIAYNTLSTAIGEQSPYPLVLADGTKVWLDAGSSITFPVAFNEKERVVKVTGEAYFEVAHNDAHLFKVIVKDQIVEDIGTHFNINAYNDEKAITITLLEGAVKVYTADVVNQNEQAGVLLKPGQQSVLKNNVWNVTNADTEETIAWKNGYFRFDNENIQEVMLKLSRWYNIDVQYDGPISDETFYATSSRYRNISEVLTMLQETKGVHFKIEGRRVTVMQ